jgi:hypothetical protein
MPDLRFSIPKGFLEKMKKYPETNWGKVAQGAIEQYLEKLEVADKLAAKSNVKLEDPDELGEKIKRDMWKRHKYYLETLKKSSD